jgi:hypothetical protein
MVAGAVGIALRMGFAVACAVGVELGLLLAVCVGTPVAPADGEELGELVVAGEAIAVATWGADMPPPPHPAAPSASTAKRADRRNCADVTP